MSHIEHLMKNRHRNTFMSSENGEKCKMSINFVLTKEEYDDITKHFDKKDYLLTEYKESIKLNHDECVILKNIDEEYQWIARDKDNDLYLYPQKPEKKENSWRYGYDFTCIEMFNHLFKFVKWEDEEPYNIKELLDNCEVKDDVHK